MDLLKRCFDVTFALLLMLPGLPVMGLVALWVRLALGAPVLFRQVRVGRGGRLFEIYKFRSMRLAHDADGRPLPDEMRLTPAGRLLRRSSLDELPQLLNVLRGDMSFVGPRPLLPEYLPYYSPDQARRHDVRPGITGWAQINGRNAATWDERLAMDLWYVENRSLALDLRILALTAGTVFRRQGIAAAGHATMPRFDEWCRHRDGRAGP